MKNKVVLIGANNYNGLGLVRTFGMNGIRPYGIIVGREWRQDKGFVSKSKFWQKTWFVDNAEDSIDCLLENFSCEEEKPIVIAYVDKVAQLLDSRLDEFSKKFILPSINNKQNSINSFSSKLEQVYLLKQLGFNMMETEVIILPQEDLKNETYPIILKPVQGGEGDKHDISICYDDIELAKKLDELTKKGYKRILKQPYLRTREEYVVLGALDKKYNFCSYSILHNLRQYPKSFGVGCFSEYVNEEKDEKIFHYTQQLLQKIMDFGYSGSIDIELFKDENDRIYVNEINWRVSGRNFIALDTKVFSTLWWAMLQCGEELDFSRLKLINNSNGYTMKEFEDIKNVIFKQIRFRDWRKDYKKSTGFSVKSKQDRKPGRHLFWQLIKRFLFKTGQNTNIE